MLCQRLVQTMTDVLSPIRELTTRAVLIPVVVIDNVEQAVPLAQALQRGEINVVEITLRTAQAWSAADAIIRQCPDMVVGIGTVTQSDQLAQAVDVGAQFAVSPGFSESLTAFASEKNLPYLPGVTTTSEVLQATQSGCDVLKFFPAELSGGVAVLAQFASLFPDVSFCPTGGITLEKLGDYLALANVCCVGGSWLAPSASLTAGDWLGIEERAQAAVGACRAGGYGTAG